MYVSLSNFEARSFASQDSAPLLLVLKDCVCTACLTPELTAGGVSFGTKTKRSYISALNRNGGPV
jgi:hypothetical protein